MDDKKRERDRRYREKKKLAEAALAPKEPFTVSGMPEVPEQEPTPRPPFQPMTQASAEQVWAVKRALDFQAKQEPKPFVLPGASRTFDPSQLDRIEALLLELVETNRKMHPNISEALGGF